MKKFYFFMLALIATLAVSAENPTLYLRGSINEWAASDDYKFTENDGVYTLTADELSGTFKIATSDWSTGYGGASDIVAGETYTLSTSGGDCNFKDAVKNATLTFTLSTGELKVEGADAVAQYDLYLLGSLNDWTASDAYKFSTDDYVVYTLEAENVVNGDYGFQIAASDWAVRYNVESIELGYDTYTVVKGKEYGMKFATEPEGKVRFTLDTQALTLKIEEVVETPETESEYLNDLLGKYSGTLTYSEAWSNAWYLSSYNNVEYNKDIPALEIEKGEGTNEVLLSNVTYPSDLITISTIKGKFVEDTASYDGYIGYINIEPQIIGSYVDPYGSVNNDLTFCAAYDDTWYSTPTYPVSVWVSNNGYLSFGNWALWFGDELYSGWWSRAEVGYYTGNLSKISTTSVGNIAVDENAPVEYFNLQGVRVANPSNGIYIQRQGSKAKKVLVK
jgi:hypothetical protein